jgi:tetratricopeptide (TPR) repeat protein
MADLAHLPQTVRGALLRVRRPSPQRYMAFLSYSHQDAAIADWLHETLEEFKVPPQLIGRLTDQGPVPKKLAPIFRDRQELAAAADLSDEIEEAIAASRFLIILCSPAAARSRWINEEISNFKRIHREDRILAAIVDGEPFASDIPGREHEECFPEALRYHFDSRGRLTKQQAEPIAADLREHGDGRKMGMLKIAAGMLGVGLDDLAQREAQRRHRRLYMITAASVAGMLFTSGLAYTAIEARDAARDQRREAEGLIGFMLGDLRQKLEPVGRLDVLDAVGVRALAYFEKQEKSDISDEALAQQWKALTLMGSIAESRGDLEGALRRYRQAYSGTEEALRRHPDDPQRMFDHAQSVYYIGSIAMGRGRVDDAAKQFAEYRRLAKRMMAAEPDNPKWQLEGVYSASNLGIVELQQARYATAAQTFGASVAAMEQLLSSEPSNAEYLQLMLEALAYHADALDRAGNLDGAIRQRQRQLNILTPYLAQPKPDANLRQKAMITHLSLANLYFEKGESRTALVHATDGVAIGDALVGLEPSNFDWLSRATRTRLTQAVLQLRIGQTAEASRSIDIACEAAARLIAKDPTIVDWRERSRACLRLRAELALVRGNSGEAIFLARQHLEAVRAEPAGGLADRFAVPQAQKLVGDILWRTGDRNAAIASWKAGLASWPEGVTPTPSQLAERGEMLRGTGNRAEGTRIAAQLAAMGYRQSLSNVARV